MFFCPDVSSLKGYFFPQIFKLLTRESLTAQICNRYALITRSVNTACVI
jgi:hypothetical protein